VIKNIPFAEKLSLLALVDVEPGQVVSRTVVQGDDATVTLFGFGAGEGLSAHTATRDALLCALDGEATVEVAGVAHELGAGDGIVMPANVPHAIDARSDFKMMLIIAG
jgi:quercetin dioxygenase-like cupin family protein